MPTTLPPSDTTSDGIAVWNRLPLRSVDGWTQEALVVAPPGSSRPRPAVVLLHGGGFRSGSPDAWRDFALAFARTWDVVLFCPTYRLIDRARFPVPLQDAANAVRWLRANATHWQVDAGRIGACGASAGGYYAAMIALTHDDPRLAGGAPLNQESAAVQALVVRWGPLDFIARWFGLGGKPGPEKDLLGAGYTDDPAIYHHASAVSHARSDAPPALFLQGIEDPLVQRQQGELGHAAWLARGCRAQLKLYRRIGHVTPDPEEVRQELADTQAFLAAELTAQRR